MLMPLQNRVTPWGEIVAAEGRGLLMRNRGMLLMNMMPEPLQPTPYADVNEALHELLVQAQTVLGSHFVGMYLSGSVALGDFNPHSSDIDLVIATDAPLSEALFAALQEMHARFAAGGSSWAAKLEAVYIPEQALRRDALTGPKYTVLEKGRPLVMA